MPYEYITVKDIYHAVRKGVNCRGETANPTLEDVEAWVEAESILAGRAVVSDWFRALEDGTAKDRYPNLKDTSVSQERADKLVWDLDDDFEHEHGRFVMLQKDAGPEFQRLSPNSRLAFAQELLPLLKSKVAIAEEAKLRYKKGKNLPPCAHTPYVFDYPNEYQYSSDCD